MYPIEWKEAAALELEQILGHDDDDHHQTEPHPDELSGDVPPLLEAARGGEVGPHVGPPAGPDPGDPAAASDVTAASSAAGTAAGPPPLGPLAEMF